MHSTQLTWHWLGQRSYSSALTIQRQVRELVTAGQSPGAVLLAEHPPVITLGRSANRRHVVSTAAQLSAVGVEVVECDRGGDVTYHGPGQLMVYPVVRVKSLLTYLQTVAQSIIELLLAMGVRGAHWQRDPAGIWVPLSNKVESSESSAHTAAVARGGQGAIADSDLGRTAKIAACGVHLARAVTTHGFAVNLSTPTHAWRHIVPCGLATPVRSAAEVLALGREAGASSAVPFTVEQAATWLGPLLRDALRTMHLK